MNGKWRIRYNREPESLHNRADIVTEIKSRRTEYLGHILKMESGRYHQKSWMAYLKGKEALGDRV
jgi:hypothetical protein